MRLTPMDSADFSQVYALMRDAFPAAEIRGEAEARALLDNPLYRVWTAPEGRIDGFLAAWLLDGLRFVEHIAIGEAARGSGLGSRMMEAFAAMDPAPVLLEVEEPDTPIAQRRVRFYERLGFHMSPYGYRQPVFRPGTGLPPMLRLMSFPEPLDEESFRRAKAAVFRHVYSLDDPDAAFLS